MSRRAVMTKRRGSKRRFQKRKARERSIKKNRKSLSDKRKESKIDHVIRRRFPLPKFNFIDLDGRSADVVLMARQGTNRFRKEFTTYLSDEALTLLRGQRLSRGWDKLIDKVMSGEADTDVRREDGDYYFRTLMELEMGGGILEYAPPNLVRRALPTGCFWLSPNGMEWDVNCASMVATRSADGCVYQSPHRPTIDWEGNSYRVAFSKHAMLQLADRLDRDWRSVYSGQLHVFGFFHDCVCYKIVQLRDGSPAIEVVNHCLRSGQALREFYQDLAGLEDPKDLIDHYYVVGYCPLSFSGNYAVAKTFLTPGYRQTPERKTVRSSGRLRAAQDAEQASDEGITLVNDPSCEKTRAAIRWFHRHGVPQVKRIDAEVFRRSHREWFLNYWLDTYTDDPTEPA